MVEEEDSTKNSTRKSRGTVFTQEVLAGKIEAGFPFAGKRNTGRGKRTREEKTGEDSSRRLTSGSDTGRCTRLGFCHLQEA